MLPRHIMPSFLSSMIFFLQDCLQTLYFSEIHSSNQCLLSVLWSRGDRQGPSHVVVLKQVRDAVSPGLCDFDLKLALAIWRLSQIKWVYQKLRCQWVGSPSYQEYFYIYVGWLIILAQVWQGKLQLPLWSMGRYKVEEPDFLKRSSVNSQSKPTPNSEASSTQYLTLIWSYLSWCGLLYNSETHAMSAG